jgi:hypothetical protein
MLQSPSAYTVSGVQRLSATAFYPSWGTTMDKTLFVRRQRANRVCRAAHEGLSSSLAQFRTTTRLEHDLFSIYSVNSQA